MKDPNNVLRILLALVTENGGEMRVPASTYDSLENARILLIDYDKSKGELVLRCTSGFGRAVAVQPESFGWTQPPTVAPRERARVTAEREAEHHAILNDEDMARAEEEATRRQKLVEMIRDGKLPMDIRVEPPKKSKPEAS